MNPRKNDYDDLLPRELLESLDRTPFLTLCREGRAPKALLERFLVQQYHYSRHFTRYLCGLLASMANEVDRQVLTENLFEEMGLGHMGDKPHSQIYREMLKALDLDPLEEPPLPATAELVRTMLNLSRDADPLVGLGALCLGAEAIVPHVYAQVFRGLRAAGLPEEHLTFFPLHIDGDDDHALTMKAIIDREVAKNPARKTGLLRAARAAIEKRRQFFLELTSHAAAQLADIQEVRHAF
jgi:pyrroloquinoline-quinone synthase